MLMRISRDGGKLKVITKDHKPEEITEKIRITTSGGRIYKSPKEAFTNMKDKNVIAAPYRVFPGYLSVSRTFGDAGAKLVRFGGKPGVVISSPEIFSFRVLPNHDFIVLGCDGIFDQLSNQDVLSCVWNTVTQENAGELHKQCAVAADAIITSALQHHSLDNVTSIIIAFENFKRLICAKKGVTDENMKMKGFVRSRPKSESKFTKPLPYGVRRCNELNKNFCNGL